MTELTFRVHSVSRGSAPVPTQVDGETINANVDALEIELVPVNSRSGSFTLRIVGGAIEEAKKTFKQDALISAKFEVKGEGKGEDKGEAKAKA